MFLSSSVQEPNYSKWPDTNCIACKTEPGQAKYGIYVCPSCDERIFIRPYGSVLPPEDRLDAITISHVKVPANPAGLPYDALFISYRFISNDTLISARKDQISFPLLVIPGIQPMTEEWIAKVPARLKLWLLFS
jgi:DNA-directed RNA polymerase subunit RPC12/RpoP